MEYSSRFEVALGVAARLHGGQVRKVSGVPYVGHLLGVASIVIDCGGSEEEAIAALLHDAIEDQGGKPTEETLRRMFGGEVMDIVRGCTDADEMPKPPWRQRKEAYLAQVAGAGASVRLVSAADKLHNARSILADYRREGERMWGHFRGGKEGTLWYYRALTDLFKRVGPAELGERLEEVVGELERLADQENRRE